MEVDRKHGIGVRKMIDPIDLAKDVIAEMKRTNEKTIYVGSVLNLSPSGKYYMPWACSNVTEEEAEEDAEWWETFEGELEKHGIWIESGEGDPVDVFAVME